MVDGLRGWSLSKMAAQKLKCFCTESAIWEGYDSHYGDEGAYGLPKCWDHPYCFCSGGAKKEECGHCNLIAQKRREGHLIDIDFGDFGIIHQKLCPDYEPSIQGITKMVWPNSKLVKEYRKMKGSEA